jgi:hypothetical protein
VDDGTTKSTEDRDEQSGIGDTSGDEVYHFVRDQQVRAIIGSWGRAERERERGRRGGGGGG